MSRAARCACHGPKTHAFLTALRGLLTVHPVTVETHDSGLALAERYGFRSTTR